MFARPSRHQVAASAKSFGLSTALWLFGLFTSMLLIGLWGRSVAGDHVTLETSARAVLESQIVNDRVEDWLGDAVAAAAEMSPQDVAAVVATVEASPEMDVALEDIVDQAVAAALAPPGTDAQLDLSDAVETLTPVIASAMEERGVVTDADAVRSVAQGVPRIVLSSNDPATVGGAARQVRGWLTVVVVIASAGLALFGGLAVWLSPDRLRQLRVLAIRIGVSAFTYAIVFRLGAWAVDPAGGRSPVAAGGAVLLGSNGHVLAIVAVTAAIAATAMSMFLVRRRRPRPADEPDRGESTGEQPVLVGAGRS